MTRAWVAWASLVLALAGIGLAAARTVRDAARLGSQADTAERQSALALSILRDHVVCITAISTALILQVAIG